MKKKTMCPLFPDLVCPQGEKMSKTCAIRINGDYDPLIYFRDHLLLHCALYQSEQESLKHGKKQEQAGSEWPSEV
jgi:hypothetical protein